jgi:hypothetical protein
MAVRNVSEQSVKSIAVATRPGVVADPLVDGFAVDGVAEAGLAGLFLVQAPSRTVAMTAIAARIVPAGRLIRTA